MRSAIPCLLSSGATRLDPGLFPHSGRLLRIAGSSVPLAASAHVPGPLAREFLPRRPTAHAVVSRFARGQYPDRGFRPITPCLRGGATPLCTELQCGSIRFSRESYHNASRNGCQTEIQTSHIATHFVHNRSAVRRAHQVLVGRIQKNLTRQMRTDEKRTQVRPCQLPSR